MVWLSVACLVFAATTLGFYVINQRLFQRAPIVAARTELPAVSVMIPARDEEAGIRDAVAAVLASVDVQIEVIVLDDGSTDRTAEIVQQLANSDARVRLMHGSELPSGWCGKQFACWQLANAATSDEFVFLDADVRIKPDAIQRAVALRHAGFDAGGTPECNGKPIPLLGGFPLQVTESFGERLLIPLINYVLLCYLPFWAMRGSTRGSASAGCGQFFVTGRAEYFAMGGHQAIKESLHDGVRLPRAYRSHGFTTDVFDASDLASVRMYDSFRTTWAGLGKNAVEGVANPRLIGPVTMLMAGAHVIPFVLLVVAVFVQLSPVVTSINLATLVLSLIVRFAVAARFDRAWFASILHPVSIAMFLLIQWLAFVRYLAGRKASWRGRTYS